MTLVGRPAKRYAQALFELAGETGQVEAVLRDLDALGRQLGKHSELSGFMDDYQIPRPRRDGILRKLFEGHVSALTWRFLLLLERKRRLGILSGICEWFRHLHNRARGVAQVSLAEAFPLERPQAERLTEQIQASQGRPVELTVKTDPALLGGFLFQIEDKVYDHSLAGRLQAMRRQFAGM